jgi:hypothetical protein
MTSTLKQAAQLLNWCLMQLTAAHKGIRKALAGMIPAVQG